MPSSQYDSNIFALYQDPDFAEAKPEERLDFLGQYFDKTVAPKLESIDGVNIDDSRQRFIKAHTLGPGYDAAVAGLYAQDPTFASAKPKDKERLLATLFDKRFEQTGRFVDPSALKDSREAFIARNLTADDRHSLYGVGSFLKDTVTAMPRQVGTTLLQAGRQGLGFLDAHMREGALSQTFEPTNMISADGTDMADKSREVKARSDTVRELRYGDNPVVGKGAFFSPVDAAGSAGYGLASSAPAQVGGLLGGPVGAAIGAAGSAPVAFLSQRDEFLSNVLDRANETMRKSDKRRLTQEETDALVSQFSDAASRYGGWEAITEAASNMIFGTVLGKAVKGFSGATRSARIGKLLGAQALDFAGEHASETGAQWGQGREEAEAGLRDKAPTIGEAFKEQAPVTNALFAGTRGVGFAGGKAASKLGILNPVAPGEHRDLLKPETAQPRIEAGTASTAADPYSEDAVRRRYQEEHSAPFPTATDLMGQSPAEVRGPLAADQAHRPGLGLGRPEYFDAPGYSEDAVRRRYEDGHAAPFPTSSDLAPQGWTGNAAQSAPASQGPIIAPQLARPEAQPFTEQELAAMSPERPAPPQIHGALPAQPQQRVAAPAAVPAAPAPEVVLRADGKPFPTKRAAEAQAEVLRRQGQFVQALPGEQGGFVVEARGAFEDTDTGKAVLQAIEARDAASLWRLLRLDSNKNSRGLFFRLTGIAPTKTQRDLRAGIDAWAGAGEPSMPSPVEGLLPERQNANFAGNEQLRSEGRKVAHVVRREQADGKKTQEAYDDSGNLVAFKTSPEGRGLDAMLVEKGYYPGNARRPHAVTNNWTFSREYFEGAQAAAVAPEGSSAHVEGLVAARQQEGMEGVSLPPQEEARPVALSPGYRHVSSAVAKALAAGEKLTWRDLQAFANEGFGGTQAEGKWGIKEAYDAMEAGVNVYLSAFIGPHFNLGEVDATGMKQAVREIQSKVLDLLPTQTRRSEEQMEFQQFSTPPHLAAMAVWTGKPKAGEVALEPSAGIGGLAVFARAAGADVHVNELDPRRRALLGALGFEHVTGENAEQLHNILPGDVRPTLIIMNPPFSSTAGRKQGERKTKNVTRHLDQALARLEPGGRLVAILSQGMSADKQFMADWWAKVRKDNTLRANVKLDGEIYKKYGTNFDNLLVVIDKTPPSGDEYVNVTCKTLNEAIDALSEVRDARSSAEPRASEQAVQEGAGDDRGGALAGESVRPATGAVGADKRQGEGAGPQPGRVRGGAALPAQAGGGDEGSARAGGGRESRGARGRQPRNEPAGAGRVDPGELVHEPGATEPGVSGRGEPEHEARPVEIEAAAQQAATGKITESLFESYRPQRVRVKGAKPHPSPLVQSAAMAAVEPPAVTYTPVLPSTVVETGALSEAQLEQVIYAGQAHADMLADGTRRGYFIGDGTGVGKGREIAGIILDNWNQGRKKALWVTFNGSLFDDAGRDMRGIGDDPGKLFQLADTKLGEDIKRGDGVLFTTYATLPQLPKAAGKAGRQAFAGGRLDQIVAWLGKDFDGVLVFDESHKMGNAIEMEGERGKKQPAQQALAGVELQKRLPNARVVYVSATGATEPSNLSYLERMGLWGEGTTFRNKRDLIDAIESGGVAAMELVSRDLKAMGNYLARTLSYEGVTYSRLEHKLTENQRKAYDTYARAWQLVLDGIEQALEETGQDKNGMAKSAALSLFWGNHQRFFGQVLTSMTMPSVLADIKKELAEGRSCVVQITNTNEAAQERALQQAAVNGEDLASLDITPRQMLMDYVRRAFPTHQFEEYLDDDGNTRSRLAVDSGGSPVENREAAKRRDDLLERLGVLKVPGNPLDMIVEEIGPEMVAEVTGRSRRVILGKEERRGKASGAKEAQEFMDGKRRVLVFSQAGGTGRSYHADRQAKNQQERIHYILQPGWRADAATQGLGRTHRSNEAQPPHYKLVTTDLSGHKRFTSSIARRLDQLGALTQGQRQTGSQGLFSSADNLENNLANDAWVWLAESVYSGKVPGVSYDDFVSQTGLALERKDESGFMVFTPPPIKQFLNRLLSMTVDFQNKVFDAFESRLRDVYSNAEAQGSLDKGVETMKAERIDVTGEHTLHKDVRSGAETKALTLKVHEKRDLRTFDGLLEKHGQPEGWWRNKISGYVYAAYDASVRQNLDGDLVEHVQLRGVNAEKGRRPSLEELHENYERVEEKAARSVWDKAYAETEKTVEKDRWLLTGMLLPVWNHIAGKANVYRLQDSQGRRHLGRLLGRDEYNQTRKNLGLGVDLPKYSPKQALDAILKGRKLTLRDGYVLATVRVAGEVRVEVTGEPVAWQMDMLKRNGAFSEIISYRTRVFVPTGEKGVAFMERMLPLHPLVDEQSAKVGESGSALRFSAQRENLAKGGGLVVSGESTPERGRFDRIDPVEITGFELADFSAGADFATARRGASRWAAEHGVTGTFRNAETSWDIIVSKSGIRSSMAHGAGLEKVQAVVAIPAMLERGVRVRTIEPDAKGISRHIFAAKLRIGEKDLVAGLVVREDANGRRFYDHELSKIESLDAATSESGDASAMAEVGHPAPLQGSVMNIVRQVLGVNPDIMLSGQTHFMPRGDSRTRSVGMNANIVRGALQDLQARAKNARPMEVVHDFEDLPPRIKREARKRGFAVVEGVYDPHEGKVWLVASALGSRKRAVEVWMHEQCLHRGLRGLFGDDRRFRQFLRGVFESAGGKTAFREIAADYGFDLSKPGDQLQAAEEYLSRLMEKVKAEEALSAQETRVWRRVVRFVKEMLNAMGARVSFTDAEIASFLHDAVYWTFEGDSAGRRAGPVQIRTAPQFSAPARGESKALDSALEKIGAPRTSVSERVKGLGQQFKAEFEQGMFDRFASLRAVDNAAGAAKADESAYVAARMTTSLGDMMTAIVKHGAPVWREGAVDVDGTHQGFAAIFQPVAGEVDCWCAWMVGKRAERLSGEGRENLFTAEEIRELKKLSAGREAVYDRVWRDYVRFKTKVLDFAQEAGVIDPEGRKLWDRDDYIPFYRLAEEGALVAPKDKSGIASQTSGIKTLKGGTSNIGDPFENIMRNFTHLVDAAVKNHAMDLAMKNAEAAGVAQELGLKWEAVKLPAGAMQAALRKVFGDKDSVWPMSEGQRASLQNVFHLARPTGKDVVHVLRAGRPVYYQVGDPLLLRTLTAFNQAALGGWFMRSARFFKRLLTTGVTVTPEFMFRNLVRDTLSAWAIDSSGTFKPVLGSLRGLAKTLREDEDTVRMLAAGASFQGGYAMGHDPAAARLLVDRLMKKHRISEASVLNTPQKLGRFVKIGWQWWEEKGQAVENSTRAEIYSKMRKKGSTHLEAAYEAKNIMDYSMRGDWPAIRFLCETVPFFGARMVGLHRLGRGYQENPRAFLIKGSMVALASVLLFLSNRDEPEFKELEDFDRDNYYHFFVGGGHYRLPKPFEVGAIFGTLPERLTELFVDDKATGAHFAERMRYMLTQTFNVGFPQVGAPVVEEWSNKSFFTGRAIVGRRLERLDAPEQHDAWTSATAIEAGRAVGASPKRLEHLVGAYFGTLGTYVLGAADMVTRDLYDYPQRPASRVSDMPILRSFYRDGAARHTRQETELYEMLREVQELNVTVRELMRTGDTERAREKGMANRQALGANHAANAVERRLAEFSKAAREIHASQRLSPEEKQTRLDELTAKRNAFAKRAFERLSERLGR